MSRDLNHHRNRHARPEFPTSTACQPPQTPRSEGPAPDFAGPLPTRVRGTGANLVAGMEWIGFLAAALAGPRMFAALGIPTTLAIWLFLCPLVAAGCALGMKRVPPGRVLEQIAR